MKPICPVFCEPCLENDCSAFLQGVREQTYYYAEGQGQFSGEIITYDFCGMFNRKLPNKILGDGNILGTSSGPTAPESKIKHGQDES